MDIKFKNNPNLKNPFRKPGELLINQLEYIEFIGTGSDVQYIDTLIPVTGGFSYSMKFEKTGSSPYYSSLSGGATINVTNICVQWADNTHGFLQYVQGGGTNDRIYGQISANNIYKLEGSFLPDNFYFIVNDVVMGDRTHTVPILSLNNIFIGSSLELCRFIAKLYYCKIYDNTGTLARDFVPAKDTSGVVCMYDAVSQTYFYNSGTGDFIGGPEITTPKFKEDIMIKTTTLFHQNTPNINGYLFLNSIIDYSLINQSEFKYNFYKDSQLWNDIKTTYPDLIPYTDACHNMLSDICTCITPGPMQLASDCNDFINEELPRLEYIESTGTQYIDTGIIPSNNTKLEIEYQLTNTSGWACIIGGRGGSSSTDPDCGIWISNSNRYRFNVGLDNVELSTIVPDLSKHKIILNNINGTIKYDSTIISQSVQTVTYYKKLYISCVNENGSSSYFSKVKIYSVKIYEGDTLVASFIPCLDENNTVCLYDDVSGTFFYNKGTGDFVAGPVIGGIGDNITDYIPDCTYDETPVILLNRVRVDIGNVSGSLSELMQYSTLNGFNDAYEPQTKPRLVGTWTINDWYTQEQLTQAQNTFDGLTIITNPNYLLNFNQLAVQTIDSTKPNYNPAVAIILNEKSKGTLVNDPFVSGGGRWFIRKSDAANISNIGDNSLSSWFSGKSIVTDSIGIVSSDTTLSYEFDEFDELEYFTGVTSINRGAFGSCTNLETVNIPSSVTSIGYGAFSGCVKLKITSIPSSITSISDGAFYNVGSSLTFSSSDLIDIDLPNLTTIGSNGFYNCKFIKSIIDLGTITTIGNSAFSNCTNLETVNIPSGVTTIGNSAFNNIKSTAIVHILATTTPTIPSNGNTITPNTVKVYVGDGSSVANDNTILQAYLADTNWATYIGSSRLDTWYNYLHPTA